MSNTWIYRIGLSKDDMSEKALMRSGFKYELVEVESALRAHIAETLDKPYKFYTSMRVDAPDFFSCSSLISYLYIFAGIWMPSLVIDKFFFTKPIDPGEARFGDIVFSYNPNASDDYPQRSVSVEYMSGQLKSKVPVAHMGMYMGDGKILHASPKSQKGKVVIEDLEGNVCFKHIVGFGRLVSDLKEERFVVEIPPEKNHIRTREDLIKELASFVD